MDLFPFSVQERPRWRLGPRRVCCDSSAGPASFTTWYDQRGLSVFLAGKGMGNNERGFACREAMSVLVLFARKRRPASLQIEFCFDATNHFWLA